MESLFDMGFGWGLWLGFATGLFLGWFYMNRMWKQSIDMLEQRYRERGLI